MAEKRLLTNASTCDHEIHRLDPDEQDPHHDHKRPRRLPSFASVIGQAVMVNSFQHLCSALEPVLRRVVAEEVDRGLHHRLRALSRSPSLRLQAPPPQPYSTTFQLAFTTKLAQPIFTGSKITAADPTNPLQIHLTGGTTSPANLPSSLKVEIVALDGDFQSEDDGEYCWSSEEFESRIVKERAGKRPLLTGELTVNLVDGVGSVGEIEFTDNSSWIRSRRFRIGARMARGSLQGIRVLIKEAVTEAFVVKDHRGELYKKHHPPILEDEVWRLEKIGKDGAFHKKLSQFGINTVQELLKLSMVEPAKLRTILGAGMSDKMWEVTIKHARTCVMGNKYFQYRKDNTVLLLSPICQLLMASVNGHTVFSPHDLQHHYSHRTLFHRGNYIEELVRDAYTNWDSLQMVDQQVSSNYAPPPLPNMITQLAGDEMVEVEQHPREVVLDEQPEYYAMGSTLVDATLWPYNN